MSDDLKPPGDDNGNAAVSVTQGSGISGLNGVHPPITYAKPAITRTPGVCGGDACIRGTRYAVWLLHRSRQLGLLDQQILEQHPDLTQQDLNDAWAYVESHPEEIEQSIRENEDW